MIVLGLSGGFATKTQQQWNPVGDALSHDASAVLIRDGKVVAAVEEERLNRIKHSALFPAEAARSCIDRAGTSIREVDAIAFSVNEAYLDRRLAELHTETGAGNRLQGARDVLGERLYSVFGEHLRHKLHFVDHQLAHAYSAFPYAGGDESLVLVLDGAGEFSGGLIGSANGGGFRQLRDLAPAQSLGALYGNVIRFLGLGRFDEYKAMGLAPYGDPAVFRQTFRELVSLKDGWQYELASTDKLNQTLSRRVPIARGSDDLTQCHRDLAAGLQECLETIVFHLLRHWQHTTGLQHLCLAGGVAHNCAMNGKILASGWFKSVFVQPAAHDAGCALGAANYVSRMLKPQQNIAPLKHVYWGRSIEEGESLDTTLHAWRDWLDVRKSDDIATDAARCLAAGDVVGWVQGASEFGPRALGNRSILADPRPPENRSRINGMIKKRESFRPFAPAVTEQAANIYFELDNAPPLPYMSFVVKVRDAHRESLGAVTHVDGTARVQTVSECSNPRFWALLNAFGAQTGVPMLLNTSFNNNVEPIVDSVEDAICCFLTTGLDKLVVGDYLIANRPATFAEKLRNSTIGLCWHTMLRAAGETGAGSESGAIVSSTQTKAMARVGAATHAFLRSLSTLRERNVPSALIDAPGFSADIENLWEKRLIRIMPVFAEGNLDAKIFP